MMVTGPLKVLSWLKALHDGDRAVEGTVLAEEGERRTSPLRDAAVVRGAADERGTEVAVAIVRDDESAFLDVPCESVHCVGETVVALGTDRTVVRGNGVGPFERSAVAVHRRLVGRMESMDVDIARDPDDATRFEVQDGLRGIALASVVGNADMLKMEAPAIPNRCRGRGLMGVKDFPIPQVEKAARNDKRPVLRGIVAASRRHDFPARHRQRSAATDMERRVLVDGSAIALQKRRAAGDGERLCNPKSANVVRPVRPRIEGSGSCRV